MWIMTEGGELLNANNIDAIYWLTKGINDSTGAQETDLMARMGLNYHPILSNVDADVFEREEMLMRLWLAIQQGGMFTATDLYRKK